MDDTFLLPVTYRGTEYEFRLKIVSAGYAPRYFVWVHDVEVVFERDDSGSFRAIVYNPEVFSNQLPERGLLESISSMLDDLTK